MPVNHFPRSDTFGIMQRIILALPVLLVACGDGKREAAEQLAQADVVAANEHVVDLAPHDMPLELVIGDLTTLGVDSVAVSWSEEFGWLAVKAGEHFALTISEEPGALGRVKADLDRSTLQTHELLRDTADLLVYRSQFPDEDLVFHHFYRVVEVGGRSFVVQDGPDGRFNESDIRRMVEAVRPRTAS